MLTSVKGSFSCVLAGGLGKNAVNIDSSSQTPNTRCKRSMLLIAFPQMLFVELVIDDA